MEREDVEKAEVEDLTSESKGWGCGAEKRKILRKEG